MFDPYHKWLGIPPKEQPPHHYRLLGVELFETDADVIDAAANRQMAYLQSCATGPHMALSQKLLNEMAAARLCLLDPKKKATYDAQLREKLGTANDKRPGKTHSAPSRSFKPFVWPAVGTGLVSVILILWFVFSSKNSATPVAENKPSPVTSPPSAEKPPQPSEPVMTPPAAKGKEATSEISPKAVPAPEPKTAKQDVWIKLFNGNDFSGWRKVVDPKSNARPDAIWSIRDDMIVCTGAVNGYLGTEQAYGDYVLKLQWRWGKAPPKGKRNSGVLIHANGKDRIWPKAIEVQLQEGRAGDFWLIENFGLTVDTSRRNPQLVRQVYRLTEGIERAVGEWNDCEITCDGSLVKATINGQITNQGTNAEVKSGRILLQSEGSEVQFRGIELKRLRESLN